MSLALRRCVSALAITVFIRVPVSHAETGGPQAQPAKTGEQLYQAACVAYLHGFCTDRAWPRGDLNVPRALVTEKAFPENEAFIITAVPTSYTDRVETRFVYEHRIGARSQYEVIVPFNVVHGPGWWSRGIGDIALAFKRVVFDSPSRGSILSAGSEIDSMSPGSALVLARSSAIGR